MIWIDGGYRPVHLSTKPDEGRTLGGAGGADDWPPSIQQGE